MGSANHTPPPILWISTFRHQKHEISSICAERKSPTGTLGDAALANINNYVLPLDCPSSAQYAQDSRVDGLDSLLSCMMFGFKF